MNTPPVLTVKDVARYLRVHESTIRRLTKRKNSPLACFKIGSGLRFNQEDVLRWIADEHQEEHPREVVPEETEIRRARAKKAWETRRRKNRARK